MNPITKNIKNGATNTFSCHIEMNQEELGGSFLFIYTPENPEMILNLSKTLVYFLKNI